MELVVGYVGKESSRSLSTDELSLLIDDGGEQAMSTGPSTAAVVLLGWSNRGILPSAWEVIVGTAMGASSRRLSRRQRMASMSRGRIRANGDSGGDRRGKEG